MWLRFSEGSVGEVDLLREMQRFQQFSVLHLTLARENGADFAPKFLREQVT